MNKLAKIIFERTYQSYLSGGESYIYKFSSNSEIMQIKYDKALKYLKESDLINIELKTESKVKLILTNKGIEYGNSMNL